VTETREPSKPRMRKLPPELPYGSLFVKVTPGIRFRLWKTLWPASWLCRNSPLSVTRDFGAVWSPTIPIWRTRVALTTTSLIDSSMASVPVDWARAPCAKPTPNKTAAQDLWNRSNIAPFW
jgi:hypothetical protein